MTIDSAVLTLCGVALANLVALMIAARRFSGKVGSSEAAQLWAESRAIRQEAQERILDLEKRVKELEHENYKLRLELLKAGIHVEP